MFVVSRYTEVFSARVFTRFSFLAKPHGLWDLSSLTRDPNMYPLHWKGWSVIYWVDRAVLYLVLDQELNEILSSSPMDTHSIIDA